MKAAVNQQYGGPEVVRIAEVAQPVPGANEVLIRVRAAAVTSADARIRAARFPRGFRVPARLMFGIRRPRKHILGSSFSGVIEAVGPKVTGFEPGDEVCAMTGIKFGAHADYVALPAKKVARKPASVTHEDAAGVLFGGTTALFFLRDKAQVGPGQSVLINGASGAVGTNAIQLAKQFGAIVTAVTSGANRELVTQLGADNVIDYTKVDLLSIAERFDVVLDTVGNLGIKTSRPLLTAEGVALLAVADLGTILTARGNVITGTAPERAEDAKLLLNLIKEGTLTVVYDGVFDLDDIVEAHLRVDSGHKRGNIIVRP
ncbi:MAG TPA: alcohol dehydrogenase [Acidimicrobiaceae bacterium]|nr:alcohol dehydrogenase [Acidimicrobiaceae bacterium]